jgi:glycosyltransferase involved in cell wall biosynthesis
MIPISAVIPVYNRAAMVVEAIESVRGQTLPVAEIVVVDDGSTDGSADAAGAFPGVRVVRQGRRGVAAARNTGIARSEGEYIAFLDSDDLWHTDKIAVQWHYMKNRPRIPLTHTDEIWIRKGRRVNRRKGQEKHGGSILTQCLETCFIAASTVMVRRELFDATGPFDESFPACEDYDLWLRVACRSEIGYIDRPLATRHDGHGDQLSHIVPYLDRFRVDAIIKLFAAGLLSDGQVESAAKALVKKTKILLAGLKKKGLFLEAGELRRRVRGTLSREKNRL